MSQRTKRSFSLAAIALLAAFAALSFRTLRGSDPGGEGDAPIVTLPSAIEVVLLRAALDPEAYAAAGVTGAALASQLAASADSLTPLPALLATADATYAAARVERDRLERLVQSGQGTQADVAALGQARADLAAAEAAREDVLDDAFAAATTQVSEARVATLAQIRANQHWHVPTKYKVAVRPDADWIRVRDCLAHVRTYAHFEMQPLPGPSSTLAAFDAEPAVVSAASNLSTNLFAVQATFDATFVD